MIQIVLQIKFSERLKPFLKKEKFHSLKYIVVISDNAISNDWMQ